MPEESVFSTNKLIVAALMFIVFYAVMYAMYAAASQTRDLPFVGGLLALPNPFDSPMFVLMPVAAFFFLFFLVDWVNKYFETKYAMHVLFLALFIVFCLAAFYIAMFWYYGNTVNLANERLPDDGKMSLLICMGSHDDCAVLRGRLIEEGTINRHLVEDYWPKLRGSAFILFLWGGIFGWLTRFAVEKIKL